MPCHSVKMSYFDCCWQRSTSCVKWQPVEIVNLIDGCVRNDLTCTDLLTTIVAKSGSGEVQLLRGIRACFNEHGKLSPFELSYILCWYRKFYGS